MMKQRHLDPRDVDARAPRGLDVAADGVDVPAPAAALSSRCRMTTMPTSTGTAQGTPSRSRTAPAKARFWLRR